MKAKFALEEKVFFLIHRQMKPGKGKKAALGTGMITGISVDEDLSFIYEVKNINGDLLAMPEKHLYKNKDIHQALSDLNDLVRAAVADAPPVE